MTITIYNSVFSFTKFSHSCHPSNLICCTKKLFQMFKKIIWRRKYRSHGKQCRVWYFWALFISSISLHWLIPIHLPILYSSNDPFSITSEYYSVCLGQKNITSKIVNTKFNTTTHTHLNYSLCWFNSTVLSHKWSMFAFIWNKIIWKRIKKIVWRRFVFSHHFNSIIKYI